MENEYYLNFKENFQKKIGKEEKEEFLDKLNFFLKNKTKDFCDVPDGRKNYLENFIREHNLVTEDFSGTIKLNMWQYDAFLWLFPRRELKFANIPSKGYYEKSYYNRILDRKDEVYVLAK